jgi:predicted GNAT family N-acyltransferase
MGSLEIRIVAFEEASAAIQEIRRAVFQVEQNVDPELDFDGLDETMQHVLAIAQTEAVGTARIRQLNEQTAKLERMAVLSAYRGQGIGREMVGAAIAFLDRQNIHQIQLNAQIHAQAFYARFGFEPYGEEFYEAGIAHIAMKRLRDRLPQ